ncbi:siderophore-interacting protein [Microbacterium sp. 179-B 1A2 NHS]|uniref:siderophore-interacting protein n=1 Tax=Microbacterium sp. 179-B 1A2 NHS TaxID=3142383 RepID=UPI00399FD300
MSIVKSSPSFRLERRPHELRFRTASLAARTWETSTYVRIRLTGEDLIGFDSAGSDDHMRLFFPDTLPEGRTELRSAPNREYTPLAWDGDAGWLDVEFAVHGDSGIAAPWAATAALGSTIAVGGPRGSMIVDGRPDAWFLAGDETAVPAMRRFAALMDPDAVGRILVEVADAAHELPVDAPPGVAVTPVHRGGALPGTALASALSALGPEDRPDGSVFGFIAAEQAIVRHGRALLLDRWELPAEQTVVKGYWKAGEAEYHAPH